MEQADNPSLAHGYQEPSQPVKDTTEVSSHAESHPLSREDTKISAPSERLKRFPYLLWLVVGFALLAVLSWTIICILVHRPITTGHYGLWLRSGDIYGNFYPSFAAYERNEQCFRAARVIQAFVAVVTLPLTSAVCSSAAVVFAQSKTKGRKLSLRQTMVLADRGWAQYDVYAHILRGHWKQYGSTLLYIALALNLLGGIISPLQSALTTTTTVWTPRYPGQVQQLTDIIDRFGNDWTKQLDAANLRYALTSTAATDPQSRLWSAMGALNCSNSTYDSSAACAFGQLSLGNMSQLQDPFVAQLPAGYSTGLVRQFLPRINSSATRVRISELDFPTDCGSLPGSFYVDHSTAVNTGFIGGSPASTEWTLIACMPTDQTQSPWTNTRRRQDFSEELYLNLTARDPQEVMPPHDQWSGFFKITVNTTAGFFELPNYVNGQKPGPLLRDDPNDHCGRDCILQGDSPTPIYDHNNTLGAWKRQDTPSQYNASYAVTDASFELDWTQNKGPLLTTALALFGAGSFISDRVANPDVYINDNVTQTDLSCTERAPFTGLLSSITNDPASSPTDQSGLFSCVTNNNWNYGFLEQQILDYVKMFIYIPDIDYEERIQNAFEAAAFLANEQWLTSATQATLTVNYDPGAGMQAPSISMAGIIVISLLLSIYLVAVLAMAIYSNWYPQWTNQLDSFAMMRIGASVSEYLPLDIAFSPDRLKFLDEIPGRIGDATGGNGEVGELALGVLTPLRPRRMYRCFEEDRDQVQKHRGKKAT